MGSNLAPRIKVLNNLLMLVGKFVLLSMLLGACASRRARQELQSSATEHFFSMNLQVSFDYPEDWYIFEFSEEIKFSNKRELLTYPPDEIEQQRIEARGFTATLLANVIDDFRQLYQQLTHMLRPVAVATETIADIGDNSFVMLDRDFENQLATANVLYKDYFNKSLSLDIEFLYFLQGNLIAVWNKEENNITMIKQLTDKQTIVVFSIVSYRNISMDTIRKAMSLVLSVKI